MGLEKKPEILAPAGTLDAVRTVIEAGADAVYVGGKGLNMRQHRASYNLTEPEIAEAIELVHDQGKRLYFTLNSLVFDSQISQLREILAMLGRLSPDAIIVQDLAVASLAREICVHVPLHASTMMNAHNAETALALKMMGFVRVIPSRDIPLHEIRRIGERSGLEMECFVHGDMCISQSSQCYLSAMLFGESANCGRCMKPCRWQWKLALRRGKGESFDHAEGYLLARKDLCMLPHIPSLVQNGIASLKIEGRMRTAEFLAPVVALYRKAVDAYFEDPAGYATNAGDMQRLFAQRVREMTTSHMFSNPGHEGVDITGKREPRFFSHASPVPQLTVGQDAAPQPIARCPELIVHVSSAAAAEAAANAGANAVYFCGEGYRLHGPVAGMAEIAGFARKAARDGIRTGVMMPHICDERDMAEWGQRLHQILALGNVTVGVSNLGGLQSARNCRCRDILADYSLNTVNSIAADELSTLGAHRVTAAAELTFLQLSQFVKAVRMPVEVIVQGPVCGMLLEHCVLAAASGQNPQGVCSMPCHRGVYALQDMESRTFPLETDRRCRNHLFTPTDVCVLPNLSQMLSLGISGARIEAQLDTPDTVAIVARIYREAVDQLRKGQTVDVADAISKISTATGRPLSDGPFDFRSADVAEKEKEFARA
ncbi:MAG: U32 family peptidase [Phycisphaerales bacterium]